MGETADRTRKTGGRRRSEGGPPVAVPRASEAQRTARTAPTTEEVRQRFVEIDSYRADREWSRYEGTAQRDLFRELRERFLDRHRTDAAWVLEVGPGPGRFTGHIGGEQSRRVLLDLSDVMLRRAAAQPPGPAASRFPPDPLKGDGFRPPVRDAAFEEVAALGNVLGFAPEPFPLSLQRLARLATPHGRLLLEIMPGTGERSRYLARLPPRAVGRLLRSPVGAVRPRIEREGFAPVAGREGTDHGFRRWDVAQIVHALSPTGWALREAMAVAPALGSDAERISEARPDPRAWSHLLEIEEGIGRLPERWARCAAMMLALDRSTGGGRADAR